MNIVDYVIIGIIGISVLFGLYRGFIASVLNMGCGLMSFLASFWVSPKLAAAVQSNQSFLNMLLHYTDASSRIGSYLDQHEFLQLLVLLRIQLCQSGIRSHF